MISRDRRLVEKVRDIVGLSVSPPESALVLCLQRSGRSWQCDKQVAPEVTLEIEVHPADPEPPYTIDASERIVITPGDDHL